MHQRPNATTRLILLATFENWTITSCVKTCVSTHSTMTDPYKHIIHKSITLTKYIIDS